METYEANGPHYDQADRICLSEPEPICAADEILIDGPSGIGIEDAVIGQSLPLDFTSVDGRAVNAALHESRSPSPSFTNLFERGVELLRQLKKTILPDADNEPGKPSSAPGPMASIEQGALLTLAVVEVSEAEKPVSGALDPLGPVTGAELFVEGSAVTEGPIPEEALVADATVSFEPNSESSAIAIAAGGELGELLEADECQGNPPGPTVVEPSQFAKANGAYDGMASPIGMDGRAAVSGITFKIIARTVDKDRGDAAGGRLSAPLSTIAAIAAQDLGHSSTTTARQGESTPHLFPSDDGRLADRSSISLAAHEDGFGASVTDRGGLTGAGRSPAPSPGARRKGSGASGPDVGLLVGPADPTASVAYALPVAALPGQTISTVRLTERPPVIAAVREREGDRGGRNDGEEQSRESPDDEQAPGSNS
ncbi:MAG: hypothetical protein HYV03_00605 [Deltaproteobacteria bacterium]|nr:hypothetical protein [Deltaproteobacteria bacterium]